MIILNKRPIKKILIIRTSSLGDIFHTFPAVSALKAQDPQIELHWLVKDKFSSLLIPFTLINKVQIIPKNTKSERKNVFHS